MTLFIVFATQLTVIVTFYFDTAKNINKRNIDRINIYIGIDISILFFNIIITLLSFLPSIDIEPFESLFVFILIGFFIQASHIYFLFQKRNERKLKNQRILETREAVKNNLVISINEFYEAFYQMKIVGVYVLYNKNKNKYYVGRSQNIVSRVKAHLEGRGNAHLFADLKYGDEFLVHLIEYESKFYDTAEQEKYYIQVFDSYRNGYNKTRGG